MKKIILDTDFLVHCAQNKVDYSTELKRIANFQFRLYIIDKTVEELNNIIEKKKGKIKSAAKLAMIILKKKQVLQIKTKMDKIVDKLILENLTKNTLVATMDANLKKILKKKGIPLVIIRQKKYLKIIQA